MGDLPRHRKTMNPPRNKPGPAQSPSAFHEGHHEEESSASTSASAFTPSASSPSAAARLTRSDSGVVQGRDCWPEISPHSYCFIKIFQRGTLNDDM